MLGNYCTYSHTPPPPPLPHYPQFVVRKLHFRPAVIPLSSVLGSVQEAQLSSAPTRWLFLLFQIINLASAARQFNKDSFFFLSATLYLTPAIKFLSKKKKVKSLYQTLWSVCSEKHELTSQFLTPGTQTFYSFWLVTIPAMSWVTRYLPWFRWATCLSGAFALWKIPHCGSAARVPIGGLLRDLLQSLRESFCPNSSHWEHQVLLEGEQCVSFTLVWHSTCFWDCMKVAQSWVTEMHYCSLPVPQIELGRPS